MPVNFIKKKLEPILLIILGLIIFLVYSSSLHYQFLKGWDDQIYVTQNHFITLSISNIIYWFTHAPIVGGYTPLTMLSFILDYTIWGFNPIGFHLQNIIWHIIAVVFIFKIFRYFNVPVVLAFFICLIFAVHPQRIESVVWISERKDVLCAAFYFSAIYFFLKHYKEEKIYISIFILFILSLLSKPMAFSLPFIFIAYDIHKVQKFRVSSFFKKYWIFAILLVPYGIITILTQEWGFIVDRLPLLNRCYIVLFNYLWYIKATFFPIDLVPAYSRISIQSSFIYIIITYLIIILFLSLLFFKKRHITVKIIIPLILAYIFALLPVCGIFLIGMFDHADRFSYIPSVFLWLAIGLILKNLYSKNNFFLKTVILAVIIFYSALMLCLNIKYISSFSSPYNLNKASCREEIKYPNPVFLQKLGINELARRNYKGALGIANRLVKLIPSDRLTLSEKDSCALSAGFIRCLAYYYLNERKKSVDLFEKISPFFATSDAVDRINYIQLLAVATDSYKSLGETQKAIDICDKIIQLSPQKTYNYTYYTGLKSYLQNDYKSAEYYFKQSLIYLPKNENAVNYISLCKKHL